MDLSLFSHANLTTFFLGGSFFNSIVCSEDNYFNNDLSILQCREVEDFARRLNSDWPVRMQEILSLGQDRRLVPTSMNDNGSTQRYTSMFPLLFLICRERVRKRF